MFDYDSWVRLHATDPATSVCAPSDLAGSGATGWYHAALEIEPRPQLRLDRGELLWIQRGIQLAAEAESYDDARGGVPSSV